jgi:uncharacterized protein YjdB
MKRIKQKTLSILLVCALTFTAFPMTGFAADETGAAPDSIDVQSTNSNQPKGSPVSALGTGIPMTTGSAVKPPIVTPKYEFTISLNDGTGFSYIYKPVVSTNAASFELTNISGETKTDPADMTVSTYDWSDINAVAAAEYPDKTFIPFDYDTDFSITGEDDEYWEEVATEFQYKDGKLIAITLIQPYLLYSCSGTVRETADTTGGRGDGGGNGGGNGSGDGSGNGSGNGSGDGSGPGGSPSDASPKITANAASNVTAVRLPQTSFSIVKTKSLTIPYAVDTKDGKAGKVTFASSNPKIAKVDAKGKVKALKPGKVTISILNADGKVLKKVTVTVAKKAIKLKKLTLVKPPKSIAMGKTKILKVKLNPAKATGVVCTFKSSKPSVLKVDKAGKLFPLKKGTTKITVKAGGKQKVITVKVK